MKYKKKPVVIEAHKITNDNAGVLADWCKGRLVSRDDNFEKYIQIVTLEGIMTARQGDYIIKGVAGEFYPCNPVIFEQTYEAVDE